MTVSVPSPRTRLDFNIRLDLQGNNEEAGITMNCSLEAYTLEGAFSSRCAMKIRGKNIKHTYIVLHTASLGRKRFCVDVHVRIQRDIFKTFRDP
eukprot:11082085-Ditylum_brightwellii.AAC.1